jgi:hypothetical protein
VTYFSVYFQNILDDPLSEEQQGRNLAKAAAEAGVECFLWSTLPSSSEISGGQFITQLYEGEQKSFFVVDLGQTLNNLFRKAQCGRVHPSNWPAWCLHFHRQLLRKYDHSKIRFV